MTKEEAIDKLEWLPIMRMPDDKSDLHEALAMAIEALKKQIPRNPLNTEIEGFYSAEFDFACPNCKAWFVGVSKDNFQLWHKPYHCECCGQALDWE